MVDNVHEGNCHRSYVGVYEEDTPDHSEGHDYRVVFRLRPSVGERTQLAWAKTARYAIDAFHGLTLYTMKEHFDWDGTFEVDSNQRTDYIEARVSFPDLVQAGFFLSNLLPRLRDKKIWQYWRDSVLERRETGPNRMTFRLSPMAIEVEEYIPDDDVNEEGRMYPAHWSELGAQDMYELFDPLKPLSIYELDGLCVGPFGYYRYTPGSIHFKTKDEDRSKEKA